MDTHLTTHQTGESTGPVDDTHAGPRSRPIVVAANRLPVMRSEDGWTASPGGLVRALLPMLRDTGGTWVGWTGESDDDTAPFTVEGVELHPVPISADELEMYYEGFSNDALWPLYHDALRESTYSSEQWDAYQRVNERFATTLANIAPPNALIWIHDYQLQLVPQMLREQRRDVTIGFFLHIPFPPYELFSRLPWRTEIVQGLLGCDLVGFQRPMGASNFVAAAQQLLAVDAHHGVIENSDHRTHVGTFPISIDVADVEATAAGRATRQRMSQIRARLGDPEVIMLGVDRLDYTKGIGLRLKAFAALLESGQLDPERHVLVQVATPTREAVEHYQDERHQVERLVGEINGKYSRIGLPVVHYLYQTLSFDELIALYRAGDVMLVTPFRDGMNLVAKEYAAAHIDGDGVLVLSEFAGAADELTDAVLVNPHDDHALQQAIVTAVEMHRHERRERMSALRDQIRKSDVQGWADRFLSQLAAAGEPDDLRRVTESMDVTFDDPVTLAADVARRPRPLLVGLDVDGVLAPLVDHAADARLLDGMAEAITLVAALDGVHVVVISGRSVGDLDRFDFDDDIEVIGSHGMETRDRAMTPLDDDEREALAALDELAEQARAVAGDGAWVERKPASVVLHVRQADVARGRHALDELDATGSSVQGATSKGGSNVLELFARAADKGTAMVEMRRRLGAATTVFVGDDITDEDAFAQLSGHDVAIKVGTADTVATRRLEDPTAVLQLLRHLAG